MSVAAVPPERARWAGPDLHRQRSASYTVEDVLALPDDAPRVVEVVLPGSRRRDRFEKPADYAAGGIKHYWRIEQDPVRVYAFELIGDGYKLVADAADELVLDRPFEIRLPVRDITP